VHARSPVPLSMRLPVSFLLQTIASRSVFSWFCEVLPLWLLALQSVVALACNGDVDGRSREPLFMRSSSSFGPARAGKPLSDFLGRWSIQERYNIDEFMEGTLSFPLSCLMHTPSLTSLFMCAPQRSGLHHGSGL
jgi:hypothetical protein